MRNWKTKNDYRIFRVLSGRNNAYLIIKDNKLILVDTGVKSSFKKLSKNIGALGFSIHDINFLILTHTHYDHCQSANKIKEISNSKIIVSRMATDSIKNAYKVLPDGTFMATKLIVKIGRLIGEKKFGFEPFQSDIFVDGEYKLSAGDCRINIIETAGHSTDSISILVDDEIAIVGDAMFGVFKNSVFPPFADNIAEMLESWKKLLSTDCSIFLPGHGREIKRSLLQKEQKKRSKCNG